MKKLLLLAVAALASLSTIAQESNTSEPQLKSSYPKFDISGGYLFNISSTAYSSHMAYVDFSYRLTKVIGLKGSFGTGSVTNTYTELPQSYSGTISVIANPLNEKSDFALIPSIGVGLSWNYPVIKPQDGGNLFLDVSVLGKYKISNVFYCGVELKALYFSVQKSADFLAGIRFGANF